MCKQLGSNQTVDKTGFEMKTDAYTGCRGVGHIEMKTKLDIGSSQSNFVKSVAQRF